MKRNIIKAALFAVFAFVAGYGVYTSQKETAMSDLAVANVEALAREEIGNGIWIVTVYSTSHWRCDPNGGASCPGTPW